jgi:hypothetical protein
LYAAREAFRHDPSIAIRGGLSWVRRTARKLRASTPRLRN